jgi:hypothetical protein
MINHARTRIFLTTIVVSVLFASAVADPSGDRSSFHYFSDQTGVVRAESGRAATAASQPYQRD